MQFYKYLNEEIGNDSIMKGRAYPPYFINRSESYQEPKQYVHEFLVESINNDNIYDVEIKNNGEEIYSSTCTCPQFNNYHTCKHIAACLLYYRQFLFSAKIIDPYQESKNILDLFYEPNLNLNIKEKANLKLNLNFYNNEINFRLSIGTNKLYVLNSKTKFETFIEKYQNGGEYKLGAKFTYDNNKYYFDEEDTKIINYLMNFDRTNRYYTYDNILKLNIRDFDYILSNISLEKLEINNNRITKIIYDMPTNFTLSLNKQNDYELKLLDTEQYDFLTSDFKYIYYQQSLYILPLKQARLLQELYNRDINTLVFKKNDIDKFSRGLLKNISNNIKVDEKLKINLNLKPDIELYFDIASTLSCKIKLKYGEKEQDIFSENSDIVRDYQTEEETLQDLINSGFTLKNNTLVIEDIDSIGYFLEEKLSTLTNKYKVYTSKKLDNVNLIKKSTITKDFSIGTSGIMSFNFNVDNINMNELKSIFNALEHKKRYHKLKNGNIINLEKNTELQELNSLINDLELDKRNVTETYEIPKYRALYIASLKDNKYKDITTNNVFDEFINNFITYQDIKIKFTKEDNAILRNYQKDGVKWLYTLYKCDLGGILADEMGLGKSIQTICFLKEVLKQKKDAKILIVCPTSLVYNWQREFDKFGAELNYTTISENKLKRTKELNNSDINIFITSYGLLRNDIAEYLTKEFEVCIIDEAQYIKNYQAKMTLTLKSIKAKTKLALTGTPLENSVTELWSIFDFLMPGYLNSVQKFHAKYHISDVTKEDLERLNSLNYQIKPFILRRKKNEVYKDLPDKIENNIYLDLPENQKKVYLSVLKETEKEINEIIEQEGFKKARFKILQLLTKLRQICIEPSVIFENYEGESIKIEKLVEMLKNYAKENHKILIFSSFKRILDLVGIRLNQEHINFYSINGQVKSSERLKLVDKFNSDLTPCFLITLKSGGTGLNLTSADIVIHLDIWWNPQVENQATDRAHRIGQTKKVIVNKLITKGTIEEKILELQNKKRLLSDNLIEGNAKESLTSLTEEDLKNLLTFSNE